MNMRHNPTLHSDTNKNKGTACSTKQNEVNEHERLSNTTLRQIKAKEQLVIRMNMDLNGHETPSNITLWHRLNVNDVDVHC